MKIPLKIYYSYRNKKLRVIKILVKTIYLKL